MSNYLQQYGIVKKTNKSSNVFEKLFPNIFDIEYKKPSEYVNYCWDIYGGYKGGNNNLNGMIFEYILATLLIREKLLPFYLQAKVVFVPNVHYDLLLYTEEFGPVAISAKTSLRERYKQADLEAIALKYVHRRAQCYLVTLNKKEGEGVKQKIKKGDVIGLDQVILAETGDIDNLMCSLKKYAFIKAPKVNVVQSDLIVTANKVVGR